jgi:hypothetical protein
MSADNWTECPQCSKKKIELNKRLDDLYGKISIDEYKKLLDQSKSLDMITSDTLREDYEQGINEGIYEVHYEAHCSVCGFTFKYDFVKYMLL